jgi:hypothetical protein
MVVPMTTPMVEAQEIRQIAERTEACPPLQEALLAVATALEQQRKRIERLEGKVLPREAKLP